MESINPPAAFDLTPLATLLNAPVTGGPYDDPWSLRTTETRGPVAPAPDPNELGRHEERRGAERDIPHAEFYDIFCVLLA